jgi:hypothetical protein
MAPRIPLGIIFRGERSIGDKNVEHWNPVHPGYKIPKVSDVDTNGKCLFDSSVDPLKEVYSKPSLAIGFRKMKDKKHIVNEDSRNPEIQVFTLAILNGLKHSVMEIKRATLVYVMAHPLSVGKVLK